MRKHLMKENNDNAKVAVAMVRGKAAFDAKAVAAAFANGPRPRRSCPGCFRR